MQTTADSMHKNGTERTAPKTDRGLARHCRRRASTWHGEYCGSPCHWDSTNRPWQPNQEKRADSRRQKRCCRASWSTLVQCSRWRCGSSGLQRADKRGDQGTASNEGLIFRRRERFKFFGQGARASQPSSMLGQDFTLSDPYDSRCLPVSSFSATCRHGPPTTMPREVVCRRKYRCDDSCSFTAWSHRLTQQTQGFLRPKC